jgi:hypothetical protein
LLGDMAVGAGLTGIGIDVPGAESSGPVTFVGVGGIAVSGAGVGSTGGAIGCASAGGPLATVAGGSSACGVLGAIGQRSIGEGSASNARFGTCFAKLMRRVSQRPTG